MSFGISIIVVSESRQIRAVVVLEFAFEAYLCNVT